MMPPVQRCAAVTKMEELDRVRRFRLGVNLLTIEELIGGPTVSAAPGCMTGTAVKYGKYPF